MKTDFLISRSIYTALSKDGMGNCFYYLPAPFAPIKDSRTLHPAGVIVPEGLNVFGMIYLLNLESALLFRTPHR